MRESVPSLHLPVYMYASEIGYFLVTGLATDWLATREENIHTHVKHTSLHGGSAILK